MTRVEIDTFYHQDPHVPLSWICSPRHSSAFLYLNLCCALRGPYGHGCPLTISTSFSSCLTVTFPRAIFGIFSCVERSSPRHYTILMSFSWISIAATNTDTATIATWSGKACRIRIRMPYPYPYPYASE